MDKKEQIIAAAIELFGVRGFDNTSIREIAKKAGVNLAMINYYFGSKEKLFEAIIEYKSHHIRERLEELQQNKELNEMDKINIIIEQYVNRILSHPVYHRILNQEMLLGARPELNLAIERIFSKNGQLIKGILEDGIRKNIFRNIDPELTIASVIGTINHVMMKPKTYMRSAVVHQNDPNSEDKLRKRIIEHLQQLMQAHLLQKETKKSVKK